MSPSDPSTSDWTTDRSTLTSRRRLLAAGAGLGVTALAGCAGGEGTNGGGSDGGGYGGGGGGDTSGDGGADGDAGTFRLLISDQPVAIDEFDRLDVTLTSARIFPAGGDDADDDTSSETTTAEEPDTEDATESEDGTETPTEQAGDDDEDEPEDTEGPEPDDEEGAEDEEPEDGDDDEDGDRGFRIIDLGGATVDLTRVVGDKAISVFEGGLPAGAYTKVELRTSAVEGVVDGEPVDVKLPSEKLQITKPFEIAPGGTLSFVFDITVVRKGNGGYNLLPVVGESGVVGRDVQVEEVGRGDDADDEAEDDEDGQDDDTETATEDSDGGPPDDAGPPTQTEV